MRITTTAFATALLAVAAPAAAQVDNFNASPSGTDDQFSREVLAAAAPSSAAYFLEATPYTLSVQTGASERAGDDAVSGYASARAGFDDLFWSPSLTATLNGNDFRTSNRVGTAKLEVAGTWLKLGRWISSGPSAYASIGATDSYGLDVSARYRRDSPNVNVTLTGGLRRSAPDWGYTASLAAGYGRPVALITLLSLRASFGPSASAFGERPRWYAGGILQAQVVNTTVSLLVSQPTNVSGARPTYGLALAQKVK